MKSEGSCILCGSLGSLRLFRKGGRDFLRCDGCSLVRVDPLPSESELKAHYESSYRDGGYALFAADEPTRRGIARYRMGVVKDLVPPGAWLDVGCSGGEFVEAARDEGMGAEGLELVAEAVTRAKDRGLEVHLSSVEDFEPRRAYDAVTAFDVLEHARDPRATLGRLRQWLRPGGKLALTVPDVQSFYPRWLMRRHWFYYAPDEHLFYFDRRTMRRMLELEGFEVERISRAYKPLSLEYVASMLRHFNGSLGRPLQALAARLPAALAERPVPLFVGELMAVARRRELA